MATDISRTSNSRRVVDRSHLLRSPAAKKAAVRGDDDAVEISMSTLSHSADGRQASYETRLAMQRELEMARSQLRSAERSNDETRRQTVASREEAALHRAENLRLQDELRSCRSRLNSALDAQEDLLQKNAQKHEQIIELQSANASLRDELNSKTALVSFLQEHNHQIEAELVSLRNKASANERNTEARLAAVNDEVAAVRSRAAAADADVEGLQSQVDLLRLELRRRDEEIARLDQEVALLNQERSLTRDELYHSSQRLTSQQQHEAALAAKLKAHKEREKILARDLKSLHRYVGKRELEVLDLAEQLEHSRAETTEPVRRGTLWTQDSERERGESERLEELARSQLRKSIKRTF
eukprot:m.218133 g.218133  ORF g.218133 m.218133 type:complete len:356 (-) comp55857_c0_seq1:334-1401(-)